MQFQTIAEYDEEIELIENELADIRSQIERAIGDQKDTGEYADPVWFRKAKAALRYRGLDHQKLLRERAVLAREAKRKEQDSWERRFIAATKCSVSPELYMELVRMANTHDQA